MKIILFISISFNLITFLYILNIKIKQKKFREWKEALEDVKAFTYFFNDKHIDF